MTIKIRTVLARMGQPLIWKLYKWYMARPGWYDYHGIQVRLLPTVFHPGWLISTKVLLRFIVQKELKDKSLLELGAGSGLIALIAAQKGARVTATDINPHAVQAIRESCLKNNIQLQLIESDLFRSIPLQEFDFILINPPYFPREAKDYWEIAFYCGIGFEYFQQLFGQIIPFLQKRTAVYMILNEFCAIERIIDIARSNRIELRLLHKEKKSGEEQLIFDLSKSP